MPVPAIRLAGLTDEPVRTGTESPIELDIRAWASELARKKRSRDYLSRGPTLIRTLSIQFRWRLAQDATTDQLSRWLASLGGSGRSQNNRLSMLREFFRFCLRVRKSIVDNPAASVDRAHDATGDGVREFTAKEVSALYSAANGHWRTAVGIFATTALRRGAVFRGIKCGWVDAGRRALMIPAGVLKNRRAQTIPLNDDAMAVFTTAVKGRLPDEHIVPVGFDQATWLYLLKRAGVNRYDERGRPAGTHSFRKGVLTALAEAGVHPKVAQDIAGHVDIRQTMRHYTRLGDRHQREALEKLHAISHCSADGCAVPGRNVEEKPARGYCETRGDADNAHADREGKLMPLSCESDHESRPCEGLSRDQQAGEHDQRGRLSRSGSSRPNTHQNDPTGICPPTGAVPTGSPEALILAALVMVRPENRRSLLQQLLLLLAALVLLAGAAFFIDSWGSGPKPAPIVTAPVRSGK